MITKIKLDQIATYTCSVELNDLRKINFFFGSTGSGKTVLSKLIANPDNYSSCQVGWGNNTTIKTVVYNEDFVKSVFHQSENFPGIFTMGEGTVEIKEQISEKNKERETIENDKTRLNNTRQQKLEELNNKENDFKELCWEKIFEKYRNEFDEIFAGYRNSKEKLKERLLKEYTENKSEPRLKNDLLKRYNLLFEEELKTIEELHLISDDIINKLKILETHKILKTKIIGKKDIDIAAMIEKLHNHDWVRQGKQYYERNYDAKTQSYICPFCQQETPDDFKQKLEEYFDETYEKQINDLDALINEYEKIKDELKLYFNDLLSIQNNKYFDEKKEELKNKTGIITKTLDNNSLLLNTKKEKPSEEIKMESTLTANNELNSLIVEINNKINDHNKIITNQEDEKNKLIPEIWRFFCDEIGKDIKSYTTDKNNIKKAIDNIDRQIQEKESKINSIKNEISELEKQIKSVKPTIDAINKILDGVGFKGFRLASTDNEKHYKIIREDGTSAKETLSEGERNFIVFLYFYHLIQGVLNPGDNINEPKIVVFDDPVSSLDSDVLFIVATLIKDILRKVRINDGNIKQVFILTHNVFFFKEVTYISPRISPRKKQNDGNDTMYYIIRKINNVSSIGAYAKNPIKSTYQLLWDELKENDIDCVCLQNTMRRIIEFYFKILANLNEEDLISKFDNGMEKKICRSLVSWINVGSHDVFSDIDYSPQPQEIQRFKEVFKKIFEATGQLEHYNMMMGIKDEE